MAITTLVGTKWQWSNDLPLYSQYTGTYSIIFESGSHIYNTIQLIYDPDFAGSMAYLGDETDSVAFANYGWMDFSLLTIEIVGGADAENATLINIIESNATLVESAPVIVNYNDFPITALFKEGDRTLLTSGKYCNDDVSISYTPKGSGGVETALVSILYNDANYLYYTDETMTVHAITSGDLDLVSVPLPLGSILVTVRTGAPGPAPYPPTISGITLLASYTINSRGSAAIYEVTG